MNSNKKGSVRTELCTSVQAAAFMTGMNCPKRAIILIQLILQRLNTCLNK